MTGVLVSDFVTGLLVFMRIIGMIISAPVFSTSTVNNFTKFVLGISIAYVIFFTVDNFSYSVDQGFAILFFLGVKEMITGIIMGFALNFVFHALSFAGYLIGRDTGLIMANMFDPTLDTQSNVIGFIMTMVGLIIFILINGHHYLIESVALSFKVIPIGIYSFNESVFTLLIRYSATIFVLAVKISAPIMVAFFFVHVASGIVSRVSPSFQVFFVLLPLKLGLGIWLFVMMLPVFTVLIRTLLVDYEDKLVELIKVMNY